VRRSRYDFCIRLTQKFIDVLIAGLSLYLAYQLRFDWRVPVAAQRQMWLFLPVVATGQVLLSFLAGTYRLIWRYFSLTDALVIARNYAAFSLILIVLRYGTPPSGSALRLPMSIILIGLLISLAGALGARAARRLLYEGIATRALNGHQGIPVLLVGAGRAGVMVAKELKSRTDVIPLGFLDDDPVKHGASVCGFRVLGPLSSLASIVQEYPVEEVIVCIPQAPRELLKRVWVICEQLNVRVRIVPTLDDILKSKVNIAAFRDVEMKDLLGREPIDLSLRDRDLATTYSHRRILITGAGGSIGSELVCQLAKLSPQELILVDKDENGLNDTCLRVRKEANGPRLTAVVADIRFAEKLHTVFSLYKPEVVFHAAAYKHVHLMEVNPYEAILNNVVGTRNLVELAVRFGVSRFVLVSTDKAVRPTSIMGASKRVCEMIIQSQPNNGVHFGCVRFGNVLGSRGSVVPIFREQIVRGAPLTVTDPAAQRFLMTIPEAVCLLIKAGTLANCGEIFVLDMGEPVVIHSLARDLIELSGLRPGKDVQIQITGLRPGEKISEMLVDHSTESLEPTRLDKIHRISGQPFDAEEVARKIRALEHAARRESLEELHEILHALKIGFSSGERRTAVKTMLPFQPVWTHTQISEGQTTN